MPMRCVLWTDPDTNHSCLLVSDRHNNRVRCIDFVSESVWTWCGPHIPLTRPTAIGTGQIKPPETVYAALELPTALCVHPNDPNTLFVTSVEFHQILRLRRTPIASADSGGGGDVKAKGSAPTSAPPSAPASELDQSAPTHRMSAEIVAGYRTPGFDDGPSLSARFNVSVSVSVRVCRVLLYWRVC